MKILLLLFTVWFFVSCGPPLPTEGPSPYGYYSLADVQYFFEIGLCFELSECPQPRVRRWGGHILIQMQGHNPSAEQELDLIIRELSPLTGLSITKTVGNANINIYFVAQNQFQNYCKTYDPNQPQNGYFELTTQNSLIVRATICIENNLDEQMTKHLLREELTQSLGLGSDSNRYIHSVFQQNPHYQPTQYAEIDKKVIRLLYDARIQPGMTQVEIDQTLRSPPASPQQVVSLRVIPYEGG